MTSVTVVDSGVVNLRNITRALEHVGGHVRIDKDPSSVLQADRIVLPGVGAFASGMAELRTHHLDSAVKEAAQAGTPILGICLGMQLLFDYSEEDGRRSGLGLIAGGVVPVPSQSVDGSRARKVPHIGWNALHFSTHRSERSDCCLSQLIEVKGIARVSLRHNRASTFILFIPIWRFQKTPPPSLLRPSMRA